MHIKVKPSHFYVIEKFTLKRKSFRDLENDELFDHFLFYTKIEKFGFVLLHLKSLISRAMYFAFKLG